MLITPISRRNANTTPRSRSKAIQSAYQSQYSSSTCRSATMLSQNIPAQHQGASTPTLNAATPTPTPPSRSHNSLTPILHEERLASRTSPYDQQSNSNGHDSANAMVPTFRAGSRGDGSEGKGDGNLTLCLRCIYVYGWFTIMVVLLVVAVLVCLRPSKRERSYESSMGGVQPVLRMGVV